MAHEGVQGTAPSSGGDQEVAERRRHKRFLDEVRVRYRDLENAEPSRWGRSRDLSLGGLCLLSDRRLVVGSHLALEIQIPDETAPVLALARVRRCLGEDTTFASGVEFLWVSEEDRANLRRLAAHFRRRHGETGDLNPQS